jgi:hypothetical protein
MDNLQEQFDALKGEMTQMDGKLDIILEILSNLNLQQRMVTNEIPAPTVEVPQENVPVTAVNWPPHGIPIKYALPEYVPFVFDVSSCSQVVEKRNRVPPILLRLNLSQGNLGDHMNDHQGPEIHVDAPKGDFTIPQLEETMQKFQALEERLNLVEGSSDPLDFTKMCLVPDLVLPPNFKVPLDNVLPKNGFIYQ